ncbi:uncharacterized protein LOC108602034 [Drosophila busckii]|uniref:uncharacterized protein LOC108602034 n=1 Tax=Drosophila busckii TaxID=30019 RepID=UPI00083F2472|nr:uncharacterized protein LOC108602034 [Drosophila busckii]
MNKRKQRLSPREAAAVANCSTSPSSSKAAKYDAANQLLGMEELSQLGSDGMPFILVDAACVTTREQLEAALTKSERKRMERIQRECCVLPLLEYTRPATVSCGMSAAEEAERQFQEDLQQLTFKAPLEVAVDSLPEAEETPTQTNVRLTEIRAKLEQLRQRTVMPKTAAAATEQPLALTLGTLPGINRQATFDIPRDKSLSPRRQKLSTYPELSMHSKSARPLLRKYGSTSNLQLKTKRNSQLEPLKSHRQVPKLINQIGELLMQLPQEQQEQQQLASGSLSYMVTISHQKQATEPPVETQTPTTTTNNPLALPNKSRTYLKIPRYVNIGK